MTLYPAQDLTYVSIVSFRMPIGPEGSGFVDRRYASTDPLYFSDMVEKATECTNWTAPA